MRSFMICTPQQISLGWSNQEWLDGLGVWHVWETGQMQTYEFTLRAYAQLWHVEQYGDCLDFEEQPTQIAKNSNNLGKYWLIFFQKHHFPRHHRHHWPKVNSFLPIQHFLTIYAKIWRFMSVVWETPGRSSSVGTLAWKIKCITGTVS
jgi:hypothetical protein